jgi:hypothetical protein
MAKGSVTSLIPSGGSLSGSVDLGGASIAFVGVPPDWTPAHITFQLSADGVDFHDAFDSVANREVTANAVAGTMVPVSLQWAGVSHLKIRSGTRQYPVAQQSDVGVTIMLGE